jgi:hypothetical protein
VIWVGSKEASLLRWYLEAVCVSKAVKSLIGINSQLRIFYIFNLQMQEKWKCVFVVGLHRVIEFFVIFKF